MQAHRLEQIHRGNARFRCTICKQEWTASPRVACPGVPVLTERDPHFKTMTALAKERKYPLDLEKPDAAYRILNAPYYGWLYDERKYLYQPLTEQQQQAAQKRRTTMKAKYGCRLCDNYYTAKDRARFHGDVCELCWSRATVWNELLAWCQALVEARAFTLTLETTPADRPLNDYGACPARFIDRMDAYFKASSYRLIGYEALNLVSGEQQFGVERIREPRDLLDLRYLLTPAISAIAQPPVVIAPGRFALDIAYRMLDIDSRRLSNAPGRKSPFELNPQLQIMATQGRRYHLYRDRAWHSCTAFSDSGLEEGQTEYDQLTMVCERLGIIPERAFESTAMLMRRIILHLAAQELIAVPS